MKTLEEQIEFTFRVLGDDKEICFLRYGTGFQCTIKDLRGDSIGVGFGDAVQAIVGARVLAVRKGIPLDHPQDKCKAPCANSKCANKAPVAGAFCKDCAGNLSSIDYDWRG